MPNNAHAFIARIRSATALTLPLVATQIGGWRIFTKSRNLGTKSGEIPFSNYQSSAMKLSKKSILQIKAYLADKPVNKAYLFGSYVRGEAKEDSDIDILVELDYSQRIGLLFVQMKLELEDLLHKEVDLVSANGVSKYLKPIIDREKELIYAR